MRILRLLALSLLLASCSKTHKTEQPKENRAAEEAKALDDEAAANEICRGSSGPKSDAACKRRDQIEERLAGLGYCYGRPTDRSNADAYWHKCTEMGAPNMPSQMKAMAQACQIATLSDETYPDAYHWAKINQITFVQDQMHDLKRMPENPSPAQIEDATKEYENHVRMTVSIPYSYTPFGTSSMKGEAICTFTADFDGNIRIKDHIRQFKSN